MKVERPFFLQGLLCVSRVTIFHAKGIRNRRRVFRLPRRSIKDASVARFASLSLSPHKPNSGENPRKGAAAPFLVVLRGFAKGGNRNPPFAILSFDRQRRFLSHMRKKAGLKTLFCQGRKEWADVEFFYFPNRSSIIAGTLTTDSSVVRNTPAEAVWLSAWHS